MKLDVLPTRSAGAAENMAADFLLLQRYPAPDVARFRHYGWRGPAWTFGYGQKIAFVRTQLPPAANPTTICRRPTGGGIVDHGDDWTYALVIPRGYAMEELRATQSYCAVHECLAGALRAQGVAAEVKTSGAAAREFVEADPLQLAVAGNKSGVKPVPAVKGERSAGPAGVCFQRAELYDVVHTQSGAKIAGAAQKRNKRGLLFQGSIWRPALRGTAVDWEIFGAEFIARLAKALEADAVETPWPDFNNEEMDALVEQYAASEWTEQR